LSIIESICLNFSCPEDAKTRLCFLLPQLEKLFVNVYEAEVALGGK